MNYSDFETLIEKAGQSVALSATERAHMRAVLTEYAAFKPLRATQLASQNARAWANFLRRPTLAAASAAASVILASGGVAFAAEGTLPGDALYPVKVSVTEPLRATLSASKQDRAKWEKTFAERRLQEAAELAGEDRLSTTTEAQLVANFAYNVHAAFEDEGVDADERDISSADFSARLEAHESVLTQLDANKGRAATVALRGAIRAQIDRATPPVAAQLAAKRSKSSENTQTMMLVRQDVNEDDAGKRVTRLQEAAATALQRSADLLGSLSETLTASSSESAQASFNRAEARAAEGGKLLKQNDEKGAARAFQDSLTIAARLEVLARASATLHINTFSTTTVASTTETPAAATSTPKAEEMPASSLPALPSSIPDIPPGF